MTEINLELIIKGCEENDLHCQELFYKHFYGYALSACLPYANDRNEAIEIMHDGFLKAFKHIHQHRKGGSTKAWLRRIMVNTAIDQYRKNVKNNHLRSLENLEIPSEREEAIERLSAEEILKLVRKLTPAYRVVFNLYVLEGYSHKEISEQLKITESTSRSNLTMANRKLRKWLNQRIENENA